MTHEFFISRTSKGFEIRQVDEVIGYFPSEEAAANFTVRHCQNFNLYPYALHYGRVA